MLAYVPFVLSAMVKAYLTVDYSTILIDLKQGFALYCLIQSWQHELQTVPINYQLSLSNKYNFYTLLCDAWNQTHFQTHLPGKFWLGFAIRRYQRKTERWEKEGMSLLCCSYQHRLSISTCSQSPAFEFQHSHNQP